MSRQVSMQFGKPSSGGERGITVESFSPVISPSDSTQLEVSNISGLRFGSVVQISFDAKIKKQITSGNTANFTISNIPGFSPNYLRANVVSGANIGWAFIGNPNLSLACGIRAAQHTIPANASLESFNFVYITNE